MSKEFLQTQPKNKNNTYMIQKDKPKVNNDSNTTVVDDSSSVISLPHDELLLNERSIIKPIVWVEKNPDWKYTEFSDNEAINDLLNELMSYDLTPQPVAPRTIKIIYGNSKKGTYDCCPLKKDTNEPTVQVTGKSPSVVTAFGGLNLKHKKHHGIQPSIRQLQEWFAESFHGVGSLGSHTIVWLDFDAKDFDSQEYCDS